MLVATRSGEMRWLHAKCRVCNREMVNHSRKELETCRLAFRMLSIHEIHRVPN